jgi:hypothetical protein
LYTNCSWSFIRERNRTSQTEVIGYAATINSAGDKMCPVCCFILAVYKENGIDKRFAPGGLQVHKVSSNIQKAVEDFHIDPQNAYLMHAPGMVRKSVGIEIPDNEMNGLIDDEFPFVKLSPNQAEDTGLKEGDEIKFKSPDGRAVVRFVRAVKKFTAKEAKAQGYGRRSFVAFFVPKED